LWMFSGIIIISSFSGSVSSYLTVLSLAKDSYENISQGLIDYLISLNTC
jgi:hypothetical protein